MTSLLVMQFGGIGCNEIDAGKSSPSGEGGAGAVAAGVGGVEQDSGVEQASGVEQDSGVDGGGVAEVGGPDEPSCELFGPEATATSPAGWSVEYLAAGQKQYLGSPSIARSNSGALVVSHDVFGAGERDAPPTRVHRAVDTDDDWQTVAEVEGQFWSSIFEHRGALYLLGTRAKYSDLIIRRSDDDGSTWTTPSDGTHGLLRSGMYHTAPMPLVEHGGRVWRSVEVVTDASTWGNFDAAVMWADAEADLLSADSWTLTNTLPRASVSQAWLEGNVVVGADGQLRNVMRFDAPAPPEEAIIIDLLNQERTPQLSPGFRTALMPGGAKKFTIRFDPETERFIALVNPSGTIHERAQYIRNRLMIASSGDLLTWELHKTLLFHEDRATHGFQYADWITDGADMLFVSRTAADSPDGSAASYHNANYVTFHRLAGFRDCLLLSENVE